MSYFPHVSDTVSSTQKAPSPHQPFPQVRQPPDPRGVLRLHWFVFWFFAIMTVISMLWDWIYHTTRVFDTPFSPPHLFAYASALEAAALVAYLTFVPKWRHWYGAGERVFPFPFPVPGPLFLTGAGFVLLGCAAGLDIFWHAQFGLDETSWSTPHNMIGWALLIIFLGFASGRLSLARFKPLGGWARGTLTFVILLLGPGALLGPLMGNPSPEAVKEQMNIPIFLLEPDAQHTFRIYLQWNLTRLNPLFVPLAAFWLGAILALVHRLIGERRVFLITIGIWSLILPPCYPVWGMALIIAWLSPTGRENYSWWNWALAGAVFGLLGASAWENPQLWGTFTITSALLMALGGRLGTLGYMVLERPTGWQRWWLVGVGIVVPLCTGVVDFYLRSLTP